MVNNEEIKSYFEKFIEVMGAGNRLKDYDFEVSSIDENDYFIVNNRVDINERLKRKKLNLI